VLNQFWAARVNSTSVSSASSCGLSWRPSLPAQHRLVEQFLGRGRDAEEARIHSGHPDQVIDRWCRRLDNCGVIIRKATDADWPAIWPFYKAIVAAGETYAIDPGISAESAARQWMQESPGATFVALDQAGAVLGSASAYPNRPAGGSHVASASFMVEPQRSGQGTGRALGEYVIAWARDQGFRAMQFNAVVETNDRAVTLWESLGFETLATVPRAFRHPVHGYVGLLVMHRFL
jgi:L-amino acid N-acyltransferase YncA